MRSKTLLITAAILVASACGTDAADEPAPASDDGAADTATESTPEPTEGIAGQTVNAELIFLGDSVSGTVAPPTLLTSPAAVQAYAGWFTSEPGLYRDVQGAFAARSGYPSPGQPLLAFTNGPSCANVDDADLMADGTRVYAAFQGEQPSKECLAAHTQIAIFAVSRSKLPADFTLVGTDSSSTDASAGPGELLTFQELDGALGYQPPDGREVTDDHALDEFVAALPSHQAEVRDATATLGDSQRAFGFVLTGCAATTAELIVTPSKVSAGTVGGELVRCIRPVFYVAVFAIDAEQLPSDVTIG
jgi:hypothetical protein